MPTLMLHSVSVVCQWNTEVKEMEADSFRVPWNKLLTLKIQQGRVKCEDPGSLCLDMPSVMYGLLTFSR